MAKDFTFKRNRLISILTAQFYLMEWAILNTALLSQSVFSLDKLTTVPKEISYKIRHFYRKNIQICRYGIV
ncbi:hypothetical protein HI914_05707 [Erysiphe necator]|nr:hypothetical protein HI914_05707 [Erysiphe necator]